MNEFIRGLLSKAGGLRTAASGSMLGLDPLLTGSRQLANILGERGLAYRAPSSRGDVTGRYIPGSQQTPFQQTQAAAPVAPVLPPPPNTFAGVQSGPAVPGTAVGNMATAQSFPITPEGQFQRYFGSSQMDRYFGGPPGKQAPKDVAAMQDTAMLQRAPEGMGLADYYRAQSATGRANMDEIVRAMGYTGDMEKWARANPMIAQREYAKQFQGGGPATQGPEGAALQADPSLGATGSTVYNFAAEDVTPERIRAFQELLAKSKV